MSTGWGTNKDCQERSRGDNREDEGRMKRFRTKDSTAALQPETIRTGVEENRRKEGVQEGTIRRDQEEDKSRSRSKGKRYQGSGMTPPTTKTSG